MFKDKLELDSFSNLIAEGTKITGSIEFSGMYLVKGHVIGDMIAKELPKTGLIDKVLGSSVNNSIHIDSTGIIEAKKIQASNIIISGTSKIDVIWAEDTVRIYKSAKVEHATIYYRTLEIEPDAHVHDCKLIHLDYSSKGEII